MRFSFWPQSLFGRLIAASIVALLVAEVASMVLVARERERFILQGSVREWSRRIGDVTTALQSVNPADRAVMVTRLTTRPLRFGRGPPDFFLFRDGPAAPPNMERGPPDIDGVGPPDVDRGRSQGKPLRPEIDRGHLARGRGRQVIVPFTEVGGFEDTFERQLRLTLGSEFEAHVTPTKDTTSKAISISGPLFTESHDNDVKLYDATVRFPDGYTVLFRVTRLAKGAPLPRGLFINIILLVLVMSIALFVTARSITRPLSDLARAADSVGRDLRQPKLEERGARELRNAARAFNTMQDRLQRYLDSRSRVLAAMSHDLKTPLTRLRLQVEMLEDTTAQARFGKQLDEMESMVNGALGLFRGLDDNEAFMPIDINEMLTTLQSEFAEMHKSVTVEGRAARSILAKPQALRRGLTNLIANAVKFGTRASILVEDGPALVIRVSDDGPGIPADQLERVFEPFYRVESSRNRETGGTGLGLSIARDVIQAHGGSLVLANLPVSGLQATVTLPRG